MPPLGDTMRLAWPVLWTKVTAPLCPLVLSWAPKLELPTVVVEPARGDVCVMTVNTVRVKLWAVVPTLLLASIVKV